MHLFDIIPRAFISYATEDRPFVDKLAADLRAARVDVWVDFKGLTPGTPDWESAIRQALSESFALILVATPHSRRSEYVRSEIMLAQACEQPIFAVWAAGNSWIDSVPMALAHIQYVDVRGDRYEVGVQSLQTELSRRRLSLPRLFLYEEYLQIVDYEKERDRWDRWSGFSTRHVPRYGHIAVGAKLIPPGYLSILPERSVLNLEDPGDSFDAMMVDPSAFNSFGELLHELYLGYLSDSYEPFTYGDQWLLVERDHWRGRAALPWKWVLHRGRPSAAIDDMECQTPAPAAFGLRARSQWAISKSWPDSLAVMASNLDDDLWETLVGDGKLMTMALDRYFVQTPVKSFDSSNFRRIQAISPRTMGSRPLEGTLFIQRETSDDSLEKMLRRRW